MKKTKKLIRNLVIFILLIVLTFSILLKDQNISDIFNILTKVSLQYVLIAIMCMLIYFAFEAINMGRTLKALNEKSTFLKNFKYAIIGFFFSSITPAASGGQPMQIYYMHKDKISVANSTLSLFVNLCSFQLVTISFALISICFNYKLLTRSLIWFFILGISINSVALIILFIVLFSKKLSDSLIKFIISILEFFKYKKIESFQEKLESVVNKYQSSADYIKENKNIMLKTFLTTCIQILVYYSIPYWVYCAFGLKGSNIIQVISMQTILYATVSGIPSPGAVGVSEGGFISIFKSIIPHSMISGAMLLNRGISFYLFVIISAIVVAVNQFKVKQIENKDDSIEKIESEEDNTIKEN